MGVIRENIGNNLENIKENIMSKKEMRFNLVRKMHCYFIISWNNLRILEIILNIRIIQK